MKCGAKYIKRITTENLFLFETILVSFCRMRSSKFKFAIKVNYWQIDAECVYGNSTKLGVSAGKDI